MIGYISGTVHTTLANNVLINTASGVGYFVFVQEVFRFSVGQEISLFILHVQREDKVELFGFDTIEDRKCVDNLLKVNGVGPKVAASIVFSLGAEKIARAIADMDAKQFEVVKGLGGKTAKKILLELKGVEFDINSDDTKLRKTDSPLLNDFIDTLDNLGYKKSQSMLAHDQLKKLGVWDDKNLVEMVKKGLKVLQGR
jgi:holliday junction DNA helicase RuvA